jgi:4-amino-4-deoxy-L-arabinose transferase-like glycosyltransferase
MRRIYPYLILTVIVLISTFIVWSPFILRMTSLLGMKIDEPSFLTIYKQYDGPLYIVPAKTFYNSKAIDNLHLEVTSSNKYFAAHFPGYPILIRLMSLIRPIGDLAYLKSMIGVNLLSTIALVLFFYYLLKKFKLTKSPLILASLLLFLPRFLVVRSAGSPESLFMLLILLSLYFFEKEKYLLAGLLGGLATMTKSPGILLLGGYGLVFLEKWFKERKIRWEWLGILLIPLGLLAVFGIYAIQYKDFLAYFHSGDNIHLVFPYSVFNFQKNWVGTAWLEDIVFYYFIYGLAIIYLKKSKYRSFFYFGLVFFIATVFVQHRDISRYSLPLWPLTLIAYEKFFTSKKFLIVFIILLPAIFLFAWNFLLFNTMPISDWAAFL